MDEYIELNALRQRFFDVVGQMDSDALHIDAIIDIIENIPSFGWISVDDALPPDGQLVIGAVYTTDIICMEDGETLEDALKRTDREAAKHPRTEPCWYGHDGSGDPETVGWYGYEGFPMICHPRYWMAMPKPPVVEVDDD